MFCICGSHLTEGIKGGKEVNKFVSEAVYGRMRDVRWLGMVSAHLFKAESNSLTMCCSQSGPVNPSRDLDLFVAY